MATYKIVERRRKGTTRSGRPKMAYILRESFRGADGETKVRERKLGNNKKDAYDKLKALRSQKANGPGWATGIRTTLTVQELRDKIPSWFHEKGRDYIVAVTSTFDHFCRTVALPVYAADVDPDHIDAFKEALEAENKGPTTRRNYIARLSAIFGRAIKRGMLAHSPAAATDWPEKATPKCNDMSFDHIARFLLACHNDMERAFFRILSTTGMRVTELATRRWEDLDRSDKTILHITDTKTKVNRVTFLAKHAKEALDKVEKAVRKDLNKNQFEDLTGYMFPPVKSCPRDKWARRAQAICVVGNLPHYRPKDFRDSYLPRGQDSGGRFNVGDTSMGHAPKGVGASSYDRIELQLTRCYNEDLDQRIEETLKAKRVAHRVAKRPSVVFDDSKVKAAKTAS